MGAAWVARSTFTYDSHGNVASSADSKGWQEGSPTSMALTEVSDGTAVVRSRYFGSGTILGGPGSPDFDGWGHPLAIEEPWCTDFTQYFKSNDMPALVNASGPYGKLKVEYLASGDRHTADGQQYCYEAGDAPTGLRGDDEVPLWPRRGDVEGGCGGRDGQDAMLGRPRASVLGGGPRRRRQPHPGGGGGVHHRRGRDGHVPAGEVVCDSSGQGMGGGGLLCL